MVRASIERVRSGKPFIAIKWRLHVGGSNFLVPAMRLVVPVNVAEDLHAALGEVLDQFNAAPSAKMEAPNADRKT
jgi:hypothetical protein